jgi:hypothetical protein
MSDFDPGPLIVPIDVKAMVHNNPATVFIRGSMHYEKLSTFGDPNPTPFENEFGDDFSQKRKYQGVYLMWTLPKALRHGSQGPGGRFAFPLVPNRWLVVRLLRAGDADPAMPPTAAAWVVQSDYLNPDVNADQDHKATSAYIDPNSTTGITQTLIGRKKKITLTPDAPWTEPIAAAPFLTAVAESNPAFAAYQPFNENVFSLFDDLKDIEDATLSYFVLGWYAQASADVLAPWKAGSKDNDFPDLLDTLGWSLSGTTEDAPRYTGPGTRTSLYHGGAFAVSWKLNDPVPVLPKDKIQPQVALGNTGIDAVLAFAHAAFAGPSPPPAAARVTPEEATELLEAFLYNMLPMFGTPGAKALVEQVIRTNWFGSSHAGTSWLVVPAETKPGEDPPPPPSADELAAEAAWLAGLNDAQSRLDGEERDLASAQRQLFEMWWKKGLAATLVGQVGSWPLGTSSADFDRTMRQLTREAQDAASRRDHSAAEVSTALARTPDRVASGREGTDQGPKSRVLKSVAEPRFWAPADPVMVVSNTAHTLVMDHDTLLRCRLPAELVSAINVTAAGTAATVTAEQLTPMRPAVNWANLPQLAAALFAEFFLLDPANAGLIATAAGQQLSEVKDLAASMSPPNVVRGIVPAVLAPWKQPWQPLYVDWSIEFFPIPFQQAGGAPNWVFREDWLDYDLARDAPLGDIAPLSPPLSGRTVLTPKPSFDFKSRIDQFIKDYPDSAATKELNSINDLMSKVNGWDFLSQTISGLHTWLAGRNPLPSAHPDATPLDGGGNLRDLIGDAAQLPPNPVTLGSPRDDDIPTSTFEGMRSGQFYVRQLTVVDAFGQTLEIVLWGTPPRDRGNIPFHPLLGDGLAPTRPVRIDHEPLRFAQLPPRVLQPARLNFRFDPAANGNAIVGWILPNHLDSGLSAFGPDGTAYGVLRLGVDENGNAVAVWDAAPGSPYPDLPLLSELGPQFDDFTHILVTLKARGTDALREFLKAVDETLWSIDPLGGRSDTFLSVLIGRPLALVAASLSFELQTQAWRDSDWPQTFVKPPPEPLFLRYQFPVRLGDLGYRQDGLIGYFKRGEYGVFNNIYTPDMGPKPSGYLKQIGSGEPANYVNIGFAAKGPGAPAPLILLMDPRASVHAQCGILPVKDIALPTSWIDGALAKLAVTFHTGPILTGQPVPGLLWPSPAERHGTWTWVERTAAGWAEMPLAPVDASAKFLSLAPTLRDGLLKLTGGIGP